MKILPVSLFSPKKLMPVITAAAIMVPVKTAQESFTHFPEIVRTVAQLNRLDNSVLKGLKIVKSVNFKGGISYMFDSASVKTLKHRILRPDSTVKYTLPIKNNENVYLEPFGMFFADRPNGKQKRPHLGLDIFVTPLARKPTEPVTIYAPLDGVVISHKRAREEDNVIANCITMLGVDGRKYSFDHMARSTDYADSIPLPTVGTILKAGDKIGYVGSTGETVMWHLHLIVMTEEQFQKQIKSKYWNEMSQKTGYCPIRGQVNPLDVKQAGPIAKLLNEYRIKEK